MPDQENSLPNKGNSHYLFEKINALETIIDSINDGFFTLDPDWNFTYVNKAFERICNSKREDVLGVNYWKKFPKSVDYKFYTEYHRALRDQVDIHFIEYATSLDRWVSVSVYPNSKGLSVYFSDVTEQFIQQMTIVKQNERLKEIAWVQSHKVRGPVASILGLIGILNEKDPADPVNMQAIEGIKQAALNLDLIIREIDERTKDMDLNL